MAIQAPFRFTYIHLGLVALAVLLSHPCQAASGGISLTGLTSETQPGVLQTASVRAVDGNGNTVTTFTGTVTLTSTDSSAAISPVSYTYTAADAGVHAFSMTLNTAGTWSVTATSGSSVSTETSLVIQPAVLVINANGSLSRFTDAGVATSPVIGYSSGTGVTAPAGAIAIDSAGDTFSLDSTNSKLIEFSKSGTLLSGTGYTGGGLSTPSGLAVDGNGQVWVTNTGNSTVSLFSNTGAAVSPSTGFTGVGGPAGEEAPYSTPTGIAIDISGNVWVANKGSNTLNEIIGGAAPAAPLSTAVTNATTGARP